MYGRNGTKRANVWAGLYAGLIGTPDERTETDGEGPEAGTERLDGRSERSEGD
ncbi:hypothetical protein ZOD2009_17108 [Haladaptatus paucihalophilus DX253]|uniref:Uncharacterized protein n=1 Tax=Haladaptatus paucihalophilus DX253 TaxID=797209 RepID=E7QX83_HALPU|nr:hypothetical protein [Haladaptatus paucihalophilus]EFW90886.1 hypothetical protein ZOD2009_17108 [Haladaptatus paucihalophilus DX253]SHK24997.1 hypothetical protein SAMN05444342_1102 [Haladaptatus paucihalophilus DX253]